MLCAADLPRAAPAALPHPAPTPSLAAPSLAAAQLVNNAPHVTDPRVEQILSPEELALYKGTTKPAKLAGTMLSALAEGRGWGREREVLLNKQLARVAAGCAMVARIKLQSMPYGAPPLRRRAPRPAALAVARCALLLASFARARPPAARCGRTHPLTPRPLSAASQPHTTTSPRSYPMR